MEKIENLKNRIIQGDCRDILKDIPNESIDSIITDSPYGLVFMDKSWDLDVPGEDVWKECLRVLKPGGHLLSFGGTRTYHKMASAVEKVGFEIRDMISWIYGSGFPKSSNIGKQVDKIQKNEREVIGKMSDVNSRYKTPRNLKSSDHGIVYPESDGDAPLTKGSSEWEGWGTSLKPAVEPIVVARKPVSERNIALNVLKWRTGGININECRIKYESIQDKQDAISIRPLTSNSKGFQSYSENKESDNFSRGKERKLLTGRFPSNLILDEEAGRLLDKQSENASRFFYSAKVSKSERNYGLDDFEEKENLNASLGMMDDEGLRNNNRNPENRSRTLKNNHPTVKPISLLSYLIRLVTPKNGIVLDPFLGSGTTAIACKLERMNYIGIEKEEDYIKIAKARIKAYKTTKK